MKMADAEQPLEAMARIEETGRGHPRLDKLIALLEEDCLGVRRERFVTGEGEMLADALTKEAFSVNPSQTPQYVDLF